MIHACKNYLPSWYFLSGLLAWYLPMCNFATAQTQACVRLQLSQQYDSNAARISGDNTSGDFLTRLLARGEFSLQTPQHILWVRLQEGAKLFYHDTDEDQIVSTLYTGYRYRWGQQNSSGLRLSLKDMTQYYHTRDYFSASSNAFVSISPYRSVSIEFLAGARHYTFKSDPVPVLDDKHIRYSNTGPLAQIRLNTQFSKRWSADISYGLEIRFFNDDAYTFIAEESPQATQCASDHGCLLPAGFKKLDFRHTVGLRLKLSTDWIAGQAMVANMSYFATFNDSNSTGSTAIWHRIRAVLSLHLPCDLTFHLMGTIQLTNFPDGRNLLFDLYEPDADEKENSAVARLTWRFFHELQFVLEAAIYRGAIPTGNVGSAEFSRQTLLFGLAWGWDG